MRLNSLQRQIIIKECVFLSSRSSGPGGQNVNKVNTKIQLKFYYLSSEALSAEQKEIIGIKVILRITDEECIMLSIQETRSQLKNKQIAINKLFDLIEEALRPIKKRKKTKPTKASKTRRLDDKKKHGNKKKDRRKPSL